MTKRVIAIASAGGHWQQLMLLRPAYAHHDMTYLTTMEGLAEQFEASPARTVPDCNANTPLRAIMCFCVVGWQMVRVRPHVVITTGALPGLIALGWGRLFRARTIWVDSIANAEQMSSSGRTARRFADMRLSQWDAPAKAEGADYVGAIL